MTASPVPEQAAAVERLQAALGELAAALAACHAADLRPAEAFRAAGIEIPAFAAPLLDNLGAAALAGTPAPGPDAPRGA